MRCTAVCARTCRAMLVSVGHRGTLDAFHSHRLELDGTGRWSMGPMEETPRREAA